LADQSFYMTRRPPPRPTLFPYTTLFRSGIHPGHVLLAGGAISHDPVALGQPVHDQVIHHAALLIEHRAVEGLAILHKLLNIIGQDRKSTRLNSSHVKISYAVFCLKKKKN